MIHVTSKRGKQRKPRFQFANARNDAREVLALFADQGNITGTAELATVKIDDTVYTAQWIR